MYTTRDEASNRLLRTIVTYDGEPHKVVDIGGRDGAVTLTIAPWPFAARDYRDVAVTDPLLNGFRPMALGFMNYFRRGIPHASWCFRSPARRMQQGLNDANFRANTLVTQQRITLEHCQDSDAFREMILGTYPTVDEVNEMLLPNSTIAVDRKYAISMGVEGYKTVYYGNEPMGLLINGTFLLREDRQYAREQLMECGLFGTNIQNL